MEVKNFTMNQLNRLKEYKIPDSVTSIECQLYLCRHLNEQMLLKKFHRYDDEKYMGNKLLTISLLNHYKEEINIPQLVLPEKLVSIDDELSGFLMKLIPNNTNLSILLQSHTISTKEKIEQLKACGKIIQSVQHTDLGTGFYLGDIHESNFIYNHDDGQVYAVDLDGCKIGNNEINAMRYGSYNKYFKELPQKYPMDENENPIVSCETDWYCYAMMVLNTIGRGYVHRLLIQDYYDYLQLLRDKGLSQEFVDSFANLYTLKENDSLIPYLDEIPDDLLPFSIRKFSFEKKLRYM